MKVNDIDMDAVILGNGEYRYEEFFREMQEELEAFPI